MWTLVRNTLVALAAAVTLVITLGETPMAQPARGSVVVVERLLTAMRAKDAPTIRASFAVDARQQYGNGAQKIGDAFHHWVESDVITAEARVDDAKVEVAGNDVLVTGTIHNNRGYASAANFLLRVDNGKITFWQIRY